MEEELPPSGPGWEPAVSLPQASTVALQAWGGRRCVRQGGNPVTLLRGGTGRQRRLVLAGQTSWAQRAFLAHRPPSLHALKLPGKWFQVLTLCVSVLNVWV